MRAKQRRRFKISDSGYPFSDFGKTQCAKLSHKRLALGAPLVTDIWASRERRMHQWRSFWWFQHIKRASERIVPVEQRQVQKTANRWRASKNLHAHVCPRPARGLLFRPKPMQEEAYDSKFWHPCHYMRNFDTSIKCLLQMCLLKDSSSARELIKQYQTGAVNPTPPGKGLGVGGGEPTVHHPWIMSGGVRTPPEPGPGGGITHPAIFWAVKHWTRKPMTKMVIHFISVHRNRFQ